MRIGSAVRLGIGLAYALSANATLATPIIWDFSGEVTIGLLDGAGLTGTRMHARLEFDSDGLRPGWDSQTYSVSEGRLIVNFLGREATLEFVLDKFSVAHCNVSVQGRCDRLILRAWLPSPPSRVGIFEMWWTGSGLFDRRTPTWFVSHPPAAPDLELLWQMLIAGGDRRLYIGGPATAARRVPEPGVGILGVATALGLAQRTRRCHIARCRPSRRGGATQLPRSAV